MPRPTTLLLLLLGMSWHMPPATHAAPPKVDYRKQIKPLLARHCNGCHGAKKVMSGFRADAGRLATRGGDRGAGLVPGPGLSGWADGVDLWGGSRTSRGAREDRARN